MMLLALLATCAAAETGRIELTPSETEVVIAGEAVPVVRFAATELTNFLSRAFGSPVPVANAPTAGRKSLIIGENGWSRAAGIDPNTFANGDEFVIRAEGSRVYLCGTDDAHMDFARVLAAEAGRNAISGMRSSLFAVYEFLERYVGCRFYFPGELGEIVPRVRSVRVPCGETRHAPTFIVREYCHPDRVDMGAGPWEGWIDGNEHSLKRGQMLNWTRLRMGTHSIPCCHGLNKLNYLERFRDSHPEYFPLNEDGTRCYTKDGKTAHLCFSSGITNEIYRDVVKVLKAQDPSRPRYADIEPNDGMVRCHCAACKAKFRADAPQDGYNSELIWGFAAGIGRRLQADGIGGILTQEAYGSFRQLPSFALPSNIMPMVSLAGPFTIGDPRQFENDISLLKAWRERCGNRLKTWTYPCKYYCLCIPGIPMVTPKAWGEYYKATAPYSCGSFAEAETDRFFQHHLNYYVYSRVAWDATTDVKAVLDEYYRLMYGAAAGEARQFFDELESVFLTNYANRIVVDDGGAPYYWSPSIHETWTRVYSPERLAAWRRLLDRGRAKLARGSLADRRFELMRHEIFDTMADEAARYLKSSDAQAAAKRYRAAKSANDLLAGGVWENAVRDPSERIVGDAALRLTCPNSKGNPIFRLDGANGGPKLKPGATYRLSGFVKCREIVRTEWYGGFQFLIRDGVDKSFPNAQAVTGTHDWFFQEFTYTAAKDVKNASLEVRIVGGRGTVWVDGLRFEEISNDSSK